MGLEYLLSGKSAERDKANYQLRQREVAAFECMAAVFKSDADNAERLRRITSMLGTIINNQETLMIDTSEILAAVAAEKTKVDSLIALANGQAAKMKDLAAELAAAIAANDPVATAKVQADLHQAAVDLGTETAAVGAAIDANTPPAAPAPAPAPEPAPAPAPEPAPAPAAPAA